MQCKSNGVRFGNILYLIIDKLQVVLILKVNRFLPFEFGNLQVKNEKEGSALCCKVKLF